MAEGSNVAAYEKHMEYGILNLLLILSFGWEIFTYPGM
jgi:hypothetical protein